MVDAKLIAITVVLVLSGFAFYGLPPPGEESATANVVAIPPKSKWVGTEKPDYGEDFNANAAETVWFFDLSDSTNLKFRFEEDVGHGFLEVEERHGGLKYMYQTVDKPFLREHAATTLAEGQSLAERLEDIDNMPQTKDGCTVEEDFESVGTEANTAMLMHVASATSEPSEILDDGSMVYSSDDGEHLVTLNSGGKVIQIGDVGVHSVEAMDDMSGLFDGCSEDRRLSNNDGDATKTRRLSQYYTDNGLFSCPGTNWCGPGDLHTDNVPPAHCNDAACRRHDHCDNRGQSGHTSSTLLCGCDKRIYDSTSSGVDWLSNAAIGVTFYRYTPWPCLGRDSVCTSRNWWGSCRSTSYRWGHRYWNKYAGENQEHYLSDPQGISASSKGSDQSHCSQQ